MRTSILEYIMRGILLATVVIVLLAMMATSRAGAGCRTVPETIKLGVTNGYIVHHIAAEDRIARIKSYLDTRHPGVIIDNVSDIVLYLSPTRVPLTVGFWQKGNECLMQVCDDQAGVCLPVKQDLGI